MRKFIFLSLFVCFTSIRAQQNPKLVVGIVVDQMRQDYLFRFYGKFQEGGFKRLIDQGYQFKNAHYNYIPTYTAPGHASIYTGTTPSNHGIVGNSWYDRSVSKSVYCVSDDQVSGVGGSDYNGKMSPGNLQVSTITDELMLTSNFESKVVGVSIKDRGSVLPAGHNPTGSYWFDSKTGNFMTSTYYMDKLPEWVENFNQKKLTASYLKETWNTLLPIQDYTESTKDDSPYEQLIGKKEKPVFPYDLPEMSKQNGVGLIRTTPFGNTLTLDMAIEAIKGESMGKGVVTDFLAVSFSSTDYIGHAFGPNSIELEDTYLRLDLEIKRLLSYLDQTFGSDYLIFLTSDHGVSNVPQFLKDNKMAGGYLNGKEFRDSLELQLATKLGKGEWILDVSNDQVFLNQELIRKNDFDLIEVRMIVKEIVLTFSEIQVAFTSDELMKRNATDIIKKRFENGYNQKLSGDVVFNLKTGHLWNDYGTTGTTHGSSYSYDTHVPILFFGKGVKSGASIRPVEIIDIAPTLSMLLNISLPSSATGKPLFELFE